MKFKIFGKTLFSIGGKKSTEGKPSGGIKDNDGNLRAVSTSNAAKLNAMPRSRETPPLAETGGETQIKAAPDKDNDTTVNSKEKYKDPNIVDPNPKPPPKPKQMRMLRTDSESRGNNLNDAHNAQQARLAALAKQQQQMKLQPPQVPSREEGAKPAVGKRPSSPPAPKLKEEIKNPQVSPQPARPTGGKPDLVPREDVVADNPIPQESALAVEREVLTARNEELTDADFINKLFGADNSAQDLDGVTTDQLIEIVNHHSGIKTDRLSIETYEKIKDLIEYKIAKDPEGKINKNRHEKLNTLLLKVSNWISRKMDAKNRAEQLKQRIKERQDAMQAKANTAATPERPYDPMGAQVLKGHKDRKARFEKIRQQREGAKNKTAAPATAETTGERKAKKKFQWKDSSIDIVTGTPEEAKGKGLVTDVRTFSPKADNEAGLWDPEGVAVRSMKYKKGPRPVVEARSNEDLKFTPKTKDNIIKLQLNMAEALGEIIDAKGKTPRSRQAIFDDIKTAYDSCSLTQDEKDDLSILFEELEAWVKNGSFGSTLGQMENWPLVEKNKNIGQLYLEVEAESKVERTRAKNSQRRDALNEMYEALDLKDRKFNTSQRELSEEDELSQLLQDIESDIGENKTGELYNLFLKVKASQEQKQLLVNDMTSQATDMTTSPNDGVQKRQNLEMLINLRAQACVEGPVSKRIKTLLFNSDSTVDNLATNIKTQQLIDIVIKGLHFFDVSDIDKINEIIDAKLGMSGRDPNSANVLNTLKSQLEARKLAL